MDDRAPILRPTRDLLLRHVESNATPRVTLHMPVDPRFPQRQDVPRRYEQLVKGALERLRAEKLVGALEPWAERLGGAAETLQSIAGPLRGITVLATPEGASLYGLLRPVGERAVLGETFSILPLLREIHLERRFRVLCLSSQRVALYEGDAWGLWPLPLELPHSLEEALGDQLVSGGRQLHTATQSGGAIRHGHGGAPDERSSDLERFHRVIAGALRDGLERAHPLVLAADETHQGGFRHAAQLPQLLAVGARGNPDELSEAELHARTWPIVEEQIAREDGGAAAELERALVAGKGLARFDHVLEAVLAGRVRLLWLAADEPHPGRVDELSMRIVPARADEDARDDLAARVLRFGGEVVPLNQDAMPAGMGFAALLR